MSTSGFMVVVNMGDCINDDERVYSMFVDCTQMRFVLEFIRHIEFLFSLLSPIRLKANGCYLHELDDIRILSLVNQVDVVQLKGASAESRRVLFDMAIICPKNNKAMKLIELGRNTARIPFTFLSKLDELTQSEPYCHIWNKPDGSVFDVHKNEASSNVPDESIGCHNETQVDNEEFIHQGNQFNVNAECDMEQMDPTIPPNSWPYASNPKELDTNNLMHFKDVNGRFVTKDYVDSVTACLSGLDNSTEDGRERSNFNQGHNGAIQTHDNQVKNVCQNLSSAEVSSNLRDDSLNGAAFSGITKKKEKFNSWRVNRRACFSVGNTLKLLKQNLNSEHEHNQNKVPQEFNTSTNDLSKMSENESTYLSLGPKPQKRKRVRKHRSGRNKIRVTADGINEMQEVTVKRSSEQLKVIPKPQGKHIRFAVEDQDPDDFEVEGEEEEEDVDDDDDDESDFENVNYNEHGNYYGNVTLNKFDKDSNYVGNPNMDGRFPQNSVKSQLVLSNSAAKYFNRLKPFNGIPSKNEMKSGDKINSVVHFKEGKKPVGKTKSNPQRPDNFNSGENMNGDSDSSVEICPSNEGQQGHQSKTSPATKSVNSKHIKSISNNNDIQKGVLNNLFQLKASPAVYDHQHMNNVY